MKFLHTTQRATSLKIAPLVPLLVFAVLSLITIPWLHLARLVFFSHLLVVLPIILLIVSGYRLNKRVERTHWSLLDLSVFGYFLILVVSHIFNGEYFSLRLLVWLWIASCHLLFKTLHYTPLRSTTVLPVVLVLGAYAMAFGLNENVLLMTLVALAILYGSQDFTVTVVILLATMFAGHFFLQNDSLLFVVPGALSLSLRGRARLLALALLPFCIVMTVQSRAQSPNPLGHRDSVFQQSMEQWKSSPIYGNGSCWNRFYTIYRNRERKVPHAHAHNIVFTNLCETGLVGFVPGFIFLLWFTRSWPRLSEEQKCFWFCFGIWSISDDPFNFLPFIAMVGSWLHYAQSEATDSISETY